MKNEDLAFYIVEDDVPADPQGNSNDSEWKPKCKYFYLMSLSASEAEILKFL